jgi:hypothetical protein
MMKNNTIIPILFLLLTVPIWFPGCSKSPLKAKTHSARFVIHEFVPLANWNIDTNGQINDRQEIQKSILLDYSDAFTNGFIIPTLNQVTEGEFVFTFSVKNTGSSSKKFFYKIYYQNESYKFPECDESDSARQHIYAWENFYGSWEDVKKTFAETPDIPADEKFHKISDRFRIVGNPRDEKRYYSDNNNNRWKRNPRVGKYRFMLVVTSEENIRKNIIPGNIADISQGDENDFINPFFYFLYGPGKKLENTVALISPSQLKVIARPDPGAGIYIKPFYFKAERDGKYFCKTCGMDSSLYRNAPYEQFIHFIDASTKMNNIPVIADVLKDNYSMMDYNWNKQFYRKDELVSITASTTNFPCQTVACDPDNHKISIKNPGTTFGKWEKQNVGIITRHGFTYGKWTVKAKLSEIINKNNMWNGLTNAIWLISQEQSEWNHRRDCTKEGYMENYYGGKQDKRVRTVGYSEIDFEILKTVPYCPSYILPPDYDNGIPDDKDLVKWNIPFPDDIVNNSGEVQVACTNWDMACWEPRDFSDGCKTISHDGKTFWAHRWDKGYRALTEKTPELDDELFGSEYYYFQIDWQPTQIIWRIGPSKEKLRVVGYEDYTITSVPNNQMLLIITQEFHNTKWWIGSPFSQDNIPFPKNDIPGEVYEMTIE